MKIKVKPSHKKVKVYDPDARDFLPQKGREVENSNYWTRRISYGEVLLVQSKQTNSEVK